MTIFLVMLSVRGIEEKVTLYQNLFILFSVLACIFLVLAVVFFFLFDVMGIIANLTGRTARKTIRKIEEKNAETGNIHNTEAKSPAAAMPSAQETSLLDSGMNETTLLNYDENNVQSNVQAFDYSATSSLGEEVVSNIGKFVILRDITLIHTKESL